VRQFPGNYVPRSGRNQLIVIDREGITGASDPHATVGWRRTAVRSPPAALRGVPLNRQLSSRVTFFQKFVFPIFWIGTFAVTMFVAAAPGNAFPALRWIFLTVTVGGGAWIYWSCGRLKRVRLSGDSLLVSNFRDEMRVPLSQIERVTGSILMNPELVWVHFRRPTAFGDRIVFMAPWRWPSGFSRHPVVGELQRLAAVARHTAQSVDRS